MRRRIVVAVAVAVLGVSACIIGPKQDDPNALAGTDPALDAATSDTAERATDDASPASALEGGAGTDAADAVDADAKTDAKTDAKSDAKADGDAVTDVPPEGG